jgi:isoleucyl-tRNA synthetase
MPPGIFISLLYPANSTKSSTFAAFKSSIKVGSTSKFPEYQKLDLSGIAEDILKFWEDQDVFRRSVDERDGNEPFVFFEGPPSANGKPGIHHVMSRTIKDLFCRYHTQKGKQVLRKAGWDTHGLPVELGVEKELGITKEDIGKSISVSEYNKACKEAVMRYTGIWNDLTKKMGYWVDMNDPYVTYQTKYIESVWWLLKQLFNKGLLYKGYTIQPYSPKAGTGLSSHELNLPGTYRMVKDTTVTAQFKVIPDDQHNIVFDKVSNELFILAWTTTPWTLPSNTALTIGVKIDYVLIETYNQYTGERIDVILAEALISKVFGKKYAPVGNGALESYETGQKTIPYTIKSKFKGIDLIGLHYEQLLPYAKPMDNPERAFRVIPGDFVTTEDGTGIVHTAPTFGADDARVARESGVPAMLVEDELGNPVPLVDLQGKFVAQMGEFAGRYVKQEYYQNGEAPKESVDIELAIKLKKENRAFKVEKYEHTYPHCWRTDKPVLYYPLDSWFIKATAVKDRMFELNKTINWKPKSTGEGRFGNWLENVNDWNLSRTRYWGIPLPVWRTEDGTETKCIGSVEELQQEINRSVEAGIMTSNPINGYKAGDMSEENYARVDLHRPYMDEITLISDKGLPMHREKDLIDVWFDSGSMPYAQWHYPFENKEKIEKGTAYPADFIAEGVDQTRGWFYTLHAIGTLAFDSVAYKNVVSNGLVLDKDGQKMSKRLGNTVDPFETIKTYGPDATRWYLITNAQPWDNLKFDLDGIEEVKRKFFRALYNTYAFFALYANVDSFTFQEGDYTSEQRPELDRWILSKLNSLINHVDEAYASYEPTKAGRLIQEFVVDHLSNWHVRLSRKRFWRGDYGPDKISAYQTLYHCLNTIAKLSAPIAPFFSDKLYIDLNRVTSSEAFDSVHLADFPVANVVLIDPDLEERMSLAQRISSMVLSLRKKETIKVRQPLQKILLPVDNDHLHDQIEAVADLIKTEVNIKEIEYIKDTRDILVRKVKPNFKTLGPRFGKLMKPISQAINGLKDEAIMDLEAGKTYTLSIHDEEVILQPQDVEITTEDIPGWLVASEGGLVVALDITINEELRREGIARELVNRIQKLRKEIGLQVTDRIEIQMVTQEDIQNSVNDNFDYICAETLTDRLTFETSLDSDAVEIEIDPEIKTGIIIKRIT